MFTRLVESLAATEPLSAIFSDASVLRAMLDFESALARAEASCGVISDVEAAKIADAVADSGSFDLSELTRLSYRAGTPAIPLVKLLRQRAQSDYVHWGATSQDVVDTALVLLLRQCRDVLRRDHERLVAALCRLSDEHAGTVMLARTLLQPAVPTTFGLKVAGWFAAVERGWARVASRFDEALYLQFGGAGGTLASLGDRGLDVSVALASELGLRVPEAPWHGYRDCLAALMAALSIYTASLGKMALDIALLMQFEVGEASEPADEGRGGSSAMPHKRNPTGCMLTIAAAKRAPGLLADFVAGVAVEQERALGGWQSEWTLVQSIIQAAGVAVENMAAVAEGLNVDAGRMRANLAAAGGSVFSEKAVMLLTPQIGREAATKKAASGQLGDIPGLTVPENYLGSAETFRRRLLKED